MTQQFYSSYGEHRFKTDVLAIASVGLLVLGIILSPGASTASAATAPLFSQFRGDAQLLVVAAHRGGQEDAPENTIESLRAALANGVDVVETDVHLSADGVPVLIHDFTLDRTTNGSGPIWNRTADELKRLDAGSWYSEEYAGAAVPTLAEFFEALRGSPSFAILELKGPWMADGLKTVAAEIRGSGLEKRVMVASFDAMSLAKLARIAPEIQRIITAREIVGDALRLAAYCDAVAVATSASYLVENPSVVKQLQSADVAVMVYTLNNEQEWREAISLGIDGIITDRPSALEVWLTREQNHLPAQ